jgi:hypothetical protein
MSTLMVLVETPSGLVTEPALSLSGLMAEGEYKNGFLF